MAYYLNGKLHYYGYYNGQKITIAVPRPALEQLTAPTISLDGDTLTMTATDDRTQEFVIFVDGVETATVANEQPEEYPTPTEGLAYELSSNGTYYTCTGIGTATDTDIVIANEIEGIPVRAIKAVAFVDNTTIRSVVIPRNVLTIYGEAFLRCKKLISVTMSYGLLRIYNYAFRGCSALKSVNIPDSVVHIGEDILGSTAYYNNSDNWINNILYNGNWLFSAKSNISGVVSIRDNTIGVAGSAFKSCESMSSVIMPNTTKTIDYAAFSFCKKLSSIQFSNTLSIIGDGTSSSVFVSCTSLTAVKLPKSVTKIGYLTFNGCTSLSVIEFEGTVEEWNAVQKHSEWCWKSSKGSAKYVTCTNGTVAI